MRGGRSSSNSKMTKYKKVADVIATEIREGQLKPGDRLYLNRDAERFGTGNGSIGSAYSILRAQGLVDVVGKRANMRYFVADPENPRAGSPERG